MTQRLAKLVTLLKELFQLDQPDLDFGVYRIMHAKSGEVTQFLVHPFARDAEAVGHRETRDGATTHPVPG